MNTKQFKLPDWLVVGGGAVVFLFGFFDWFDTGPTSSSAFKFTLTGVFPWLLIVASALLTYQIKTGMLRVEKWAWPTIFLFATIIGAFLIMLRLILGAKLGDFGDLPDGVSNTKFDRKFTLWLSFLGAIAAAIGAFLNFVGEGGTVNDLPLVGRIRAARSATPKATAPRRSSSDHARRLPPAEQDRPFVDPDDY